jgi:hypothetical protein
MDFDQVLEIVGIDDILIAEETQGRYRHVEANEKIEQKYLMQAEVFLRELKPLREHILIISTLL